MYLVHLSVIGLDPERLAIEFKNLGRQGLIRQASHRIGKPLAFMSSISSFGVTLHNDCLNRVLALLESIYDDLRLYIHFFQPSFKLIAKERIGNKTIKRYDTPKTPCQRILERQDISLETCSVTFLLDATLPSKQHFILMLHVTNIM